MRIIGIVKRAAIPVVCAALILFAAGCKKNIQTNDAVKAAVVNHLSKNTGLSLSGMTIDVTNVTFRENEAEALVSFTPKSGPANAGMSMRYTLVRKGNDWEVKSKADSGGHGAGGPMPGAAPAAPETGMPADHPPIPKGAPKK
jgi:hypothetical protein